MPAQALQVVAGKANTFLVWLTKINLPIQIMSQGQWFVAPPDWRDRNKEKQKQRETERQRKRWGETEIGVCPKCERERECLCV